MAPHVPAFALLALLALSSSCLAVSPLDSARPLLIPAGDGSYGSIEDTFYAASVLSAAKDPSLDAAKTCAWASKQPLPKGASLSAASALAQLSALACSSAPSSVKDAEAALVAGAQAASTVKEASLALEGLKAIKAKSWSSTDLSSATKAAAALIESLAHSDGSWKASKESTDTSALSTGYALKSLAALLTLKGVTKDKALELSRNMKSLFNQAVTGDSKALYFDGKVEEGGALPASALIASSYIALASALGSPLEVPRESVAALGLFLASAGAPLSLSEAHLLFQALAALDSNSVAVPVLVSVPGQFSVSSSSASASSAPAVALRTVLGGSVTGAAVSMGSARLAGKGSASKLVAQGKELVASGASFPLPSEVFSKSSALGLYTLKLDVSPSGAAQVALSPVTASVAATAKISISAATVSVADSEKGSAESEAKVELGAAKAELRTLTATHLQKLRVTVTLTTPGGKGFAPHQAFLTMTHDSGIAHSFLLKSSGDSGLLSLKLDLLESLEKLYYLSGLYSLELTLGDPFMENSGSWALGSVDLDLPEAPDSAPKAPALPKSLGERFGPKGEIAHIFRKPEKRPPTAVSLVFTALALLPLLLLVGGLAALGVNFSLFPSSGVPFLAALGFHGGIAGILLLYFAFWIQVPLFTTLKVLLLLGLVTALPGHYILAFLADSSVKAKAS